PWRETIHDVVGAELAVAVGAPALRATVGDRAGVLETARDGLGAEQDPRDRDRHEAQRARVRIDGELAVAVAPPALDLAGADRTDVAKPGRERLGAVTRYHDGHRRWARDPGIVAELAEGVVAPALDRAAGEQRAGAELARGDRPDAARQRRHRDRRARG